MAGESNNRDAVVAPGEYLYVLDTTKGKVDTIVGPSKISMSDTDQPVVWDKEKRRFARVERDRAIQTNSIAPEGFYIALFNPAETQPRDGQISAAAPLHVGHRVNIPGPVQFPLWPGQFAEVIRGHHLRTNQYLLAQVYNDVEAVKHWQTAVVKAADQSEGDAPALTVAPPRSFAPGQMLIIKGTEVAFFMPPTGIKVVAENGVYVRDAVTLERLEYCILLGENGNKRYVQGPAVVFPEPTEAFIARDGQRKFRAIELNATTGLYIKVIADYEEHGTTHKTGDELFITGAEQAIYFQREEHSIIRYDDQTKHYAVAIPPGEGRYVLDRMTGDPRLAAGPQMLLCDPRREVIIRRVLDATAVALWYPGNERAKRVNQELEALAAATGAQNAYEVGRALRSQNFMAMSDSSGAGASAAAYSTQVAGDKFQRGGAFTPPRTITLDTKYDGAVGISPWAGYAVLVADKSGHRRVVEGPASVLLKYDESLATLELSTGTPKTDTPLMKTVYLRTRNNKVSDRITVETQDLVQVDLTVSYRVNFTGDDKEKWFSVENYVRLLCDHMRSLLRGVAKGTGIAEFYGNTIDIVRTAVLAEPTFDENAMQVYDVEVLDVKIKDANVAGLLMGAQTDALTNALTLAKAERTLEFTTRNEAITREILTEQTATVAATLAKEQALMAAQAAIVDAREAMTAVQHAAELARAAASAEQQSASRERAVAVEVGRIKGETDEIVKRAAAVTDKMAVALTTFADQALVEKMTTALAPMAAMNGTSSADILSQLFKGTPFGGTMEMLGARARMPVGTSA